MDWLNKCTRGTWTLNSDNKIDVKGDFSCSHQELTDFKGVEFGEITRNFNCSSNHLTSLKGCPQTVLRSFECYGNPVSANALIPIFYKMKALNIPYIQAVEVLWDSIPLDDQVLLYRPGFGWIDAEEKKKLESISRINKIKNLI
jgi:hypothetical protein